MASELTGTLGNYITRVRRYLKEENAAKSHWKDDFLKHLFNTQYRRRCAQLHMAYEGFFTEVAIRDLIANSERYAWPAGFERLTKMELVRSDGRTVPIERFERHIDVKQIPQTGGDTYRPHFRPIGSGFVLEPAPNEAVVGGLRIEFLTTPTELTNDSDLIHSDFPSMLDEILVLDTAVAAFDQEGQQETGQLRTLLRLRQEWELDWERYIDNRIVMSQQVTPFAAHYHDA